MAYVFISQVEEATVVMEDDSSAELVSTPGTQRNLSAWAITIPYVDFFEDEAKREKIPVFCIDVERNDRKEGKCWMGRGLSIDVLRDRMHESLSTFR